MSSLFNLPSSCVFDTEGNMHQLELTSANDILLDGQPTAVVTLTAETLCLSRAEKKYTISLADFWHACAGGDPTAREAGLYLAGCVAAKHYQAQVQQLLALKQPIGGESLVPPFRLDPCVELVLRGGYDGTSEATQTIARILGKNTVQVENLARRVGLAKEVPLHADTATYPAEEGKQQATGDITPTDGGGNVKGETPQVEETASYMSPSEASPHYSPNQPMLTSTGEEKRPFTWTDEQVKILRRAFAADKASPLQVIAKKLAAQHGWPERAVANKAYYLGFAKLENRPSVEAETAPEAQKEVNTDEGCHHSDDREQKDSPVNDVVQPSHTKPDLLPIFHWAPAYTRTLINNYYALDAAIRQDRRKAAEQIAHQRHWPVPATEEKICELKLDEKRLLSFGNHRWTIKVGETSTLWNLDYAYGKFPLSPGEHFTFEGEDYLLRRVYSNMLTVERASNAKSTDPEQAQSLASLAS